MLESIIYLSIKINYALNAVMCLSMFELKGKCGNPYCVAEGSRMSTVVKSEHDFLVFPKDFI